MSDRVRSLRDMLKQRQEAELAIAKANRPIDMNQARESLQGSYALAKHQNDLSPIQVDDDTLKSLFNRLLGPSMAQQVIDQYLSSAGRTIQENIGDDETANLMRPMIASVLQLDR